VSVWVVGAIHRDVVVRAPRLPDLDETLAGDEVAYLPGGKGLNQAVAAVRMGAEVAMTGAVGRDAAGREMLAALRRAGVDATAVARLPEPTGMSVAIVTAEGAYGAVIVSGANRHVSGAVAPPPGARVLLLQSEIPEAANLEAARRARAAGLTVILNAAPARPVDAGLLAQVDLLVVNRVEAAALGGCDDPVAAARRLAGRGVPRVIVTLGAAGLICRGADGSGFEQPAPAADVVSTHGAGDVFLGALAARLDAGEALAEACAFAQAAAALHVSLPAGRRAGLTAARVRAAMARARPGPARGPAR
jgi:ribokinase